jgi:hypothetical protein
VGELRISLEHDVRIDAVGARMRVGAAPLDMGLATSSSATLSVRLTVDVEVTANDAR